MSRAEVLPPLREFPGLIPTSGDYYLCPGGRRVRVTSALKFFSDGSENLYGWYEKNGKEIALEAVRENFAWFKDLDVEKFASAIELAITDVRASRRKLEKAADIGTQIHQRIEWKMRVESGLEAGPEPKLEGPAWLGYTAWEEWWRDSGLKVVAAEQVVWDEDWDYAGKIDCLAQDPDGSLVLCDWKSSNYLVSKHHVQAAAYLRALRLWRPVRRAILVRTPKTLADISIEVRELGDTFDMSSKKRALKTEDQLLTAFKASLDLYRVFKM